MTIWAALARRRGILVQGSVVNVGINGDAVSWAALVINKASVDWHEIQLGLLDVLLVLRA